MDVGDHKTGDGGDQQSAMKKVKGKGEAERVR